MKKLLKILLVIFVVSVLAATLIACNNNPCKKDGHKEDKGTVTKQATCTVDGEITYKCLECGEVVRTEKINALDHDWEITSSTATCTDAGNTLYTCKRAGCNTGEGGKAATKTEAGVALGHDFTNAQWTDSTATCENDGVEYMYCQRQGCDHSGEGTKQRTATKLGHQLVENKCVRFDTCGKEMSEEEVVAAFVQFKQDTAFVKNSSVAMMEGSTFKLTGTIATVVSRNNTYHSVTVNLNINGTTIQAYGMINGEADDDVYTLVEGDKITVVGELKLYASNSATAWTMEFDQNCTLKAVVEKVQYNVKWTYSQEDATVALAEGQGALPDKVNANASVSFTVTPIGEGKQVLSVKANGNVVENVDGVYTVQITEDNMEIVVSVGVEGMPVPEKLVKLDFEDSTRNFRNDNNKANAYTSDTKFSVTDYGYTWNFTGFSNYDWGWTDIIKAIGNNNDKLVATISSNFEEQITSIVLKAKLNAATPIVNVKLEVLKDGQVIYTQTKDFTSTVTTELTFDVKAFEDNCQYKLTFSSSTAAASNGLFWLYGITYYSIDCDHEWSNESTTAANCTETGSYSATCSKCTLSKEATLPTNGIHSFMNDSKEATGSPASARVEAGADEFGHLDIYLCSHCNHYWAKVEGNWTDLGEELEAAIAQVRIHDATHTNLHYADNHNGTHGITCDDCGYTATQSCNANGDEGACDKCGYKDESAVLVDVEVTYVVDGAEAVADAPQNLEITWREGGYTIDAPSKLTVGKTYTIAIGLNDKYTFVKISIKGSEISAWQDQFAVNFSEEDVAGGIAIIITINTVNDPEIVFQSNIDSDSIAAYNGGETLGNGYGKAYSFTITNDKYSMPFTAYSFTKQSGYYRFGGQASIANVHSSNEYGGYLQTAQAFDKEITEIKLNVKAKDNNFKNVILYVSSTPLDAASASPAAKSDWLDVVTIASVSANSVISFTPSAGIKWSAGVYFRIVVTKSSINSNSKNSGLDITAMEFWGK